MVSLGLSKPDRPLLHVLAIDPGDIHQGTVYGQLDCKFNNDTDVGDWTALRHWTRDLGRYALEDLLWDASVDAFIVEAFVLYPELARAQGYSEFLTSQMIGVVRHVGRRRNIPVYVQGASFKSRARRIGEKLGFPGQEQWIGSGKDKYWGWDFDGPSQHEKDATAHFVWWTFKNKHSLMYDLHLSGARLAVAA